MTFDRGRNIGRHVVCLHIYEHTEDRQKKVRRTKIDDIDAGCRDVERPENKSRIFCSETTNLACACDNVLVLTYTSKVYQIHLLDEVVNGS